MSSKRKGFLHNLCYKSAVFTLCLSFLASVFPLISSSWNYCVDETIHAECLVDGMLKPPPPTSFSPSFSSSCFSFCSTICSDTYANVRGLNPWPLQLLCSFLAFLWSWWTLVSLATCSVFCREILREEFRDYTFGHKVIGIPLFFLSYL